MARTLDVDDPELVDAIEVATDADPDDDGRLFENPRAAVRALPEVRDREHGQEVRRVARRRRARAALGM